MAERTLIDDPDGTNLDRGLGETIQFGVDGRANEIAFSDGNAIARGLRAEKNTWDEISDALQVSSASVRRALRRPATEDNDASVR